MEDKALTQAERALSEQYWGWSCLDARRRTNLPESGVQALGASSGCSGIPACERRWSVWWSPPREGVGRYKNGGKEWMPAGAPEQVKVHGFVDVEVGGGVGTRPSCWVS